MINIVKLSLGGVILYNFLPNSHSRHKPKLPNINNLTEENPFMINEPEISLALYGELNGEPHYYKIESKEAFDFYVGILTPKLKSENKFPKNKVYFTILNENKEEILFPKYPTGILDDHQWTEWYEPYGKQWYWVGPEIGQNFKHVEDYKDFKEGIYYIKVFNQKNEGRYSLAVGDQEKFSFFDILGIPFILPKINKLWDEE